MDSIAQNTKITTTQINSLITEMNGKLNLSGGTMYGDLNLNKHLLVNVGSVELSTSSSSGHGGYIDFHYNGSSDDFTSRIIESSSGCINFISPNGIHSTGTYFTSQRKGLVASESNSYMDVGYSYDNAKGALIAFRGPNYGNDLDGAFDIFARNPTSTNILSGNPNGILTWSGLNFDLPYSTRLSSFSSTVEGNALYETILGYVKETPGAHVILRRGDSLAWGQAGMAGLCARTSDAATYLLVYPNGTAYLADKRVMTESGGTFTGVVVVPYFEINPQNNDAEGGELRLRAANNQFRHIIFDNYSDNARFIFQNADNSVYSIYNFSKDGVISTPKGDIWIA